MMMFIAGSNAFAQKDQLKELTYYAKEDVKTQSPPSFPGGHSALTKFIKTELLNSSDLVKLPRKVYITAQIDETGNIVNLKPAYNADPALEKELKKITSSMPKWEAGKINGKGVVTDYTFLLKRNW
jgi:hypothetical protein